MTQLEERLVPPQTKGHVSVAKLSAHWYVACPSKTLRKKPIARTILGIPMVLFRDGSGKASVLLDRCPHRNVPLSMGSVVEGNLECTYHGWQFDGGGVCRLVPGLIEGKHERHGREVESFPVREQDGFVWVYPEAGAEPVTEPFPMPHTHTAGYTTVVREVEVQGTLHWTCENALDVPHTAFLHKGLFRGGKKNQITAVIKRYHDRVEAEYIGEPRPPGLIAKLLSPSGGVVEHFDRFFLPSIAQVEYRLGSENHILITSACTPVSDFHTVMTAVISFNMRIPGPVLKPMLEPLAMRVFKQDAQILKIQSDTVKAFGGEQFMNTDIDVLGPQIWRLLKQAERGETPPASDEPISEKQLELMV